MILVKSSVQDSGDSGDILTSIICSVGALFSMVIVILGIKFKWFKHRLNLQSLSAGSEKRDNSGGVSQSDTAPLQGVFRRKVDADSFVDIERPKTLPPVRIRNSELQLPIPSRLSLTENPAISSNEQITVVPPMPPPMPMPSLGQRDDNRSQKNTRSRSSSQPKSESNSKFEESTSGKNSSSRKKKTVDLKSENTKSPLPEYSDGEKKRPRDQEKYKREQEKRSGKRSGSSELKKKSRNVGVTHQPADQTRHFEKLKDDKQTTKGDHHNSRLAERRPTGYIRPKDDEIEALEQLSNRERKIILKLDVASNDDEDNQKIFEKVKAKAPVPEPRKRPSNENKPTPVQSDDSWSAVARHKIVTEELTKQHSALKPVTMKTKSNGISEFRNQISDKKPRTMRDMKKNQGASQNERIVLCQEQTHDTEA